MKKIEEWEIDQRDETSQYLHMLKRWIITHKNLPSTAPALHHQIEDFRITHQVESSQIIDILLKNETIALEGGISNQIVYNLNNTLNLADTDISSEKTDDNLKVRTFPELGFSDELCRAMYTRGIYVPSLTQEQLYRKIFSDSAEVYCIGPAGCGKTIGAVLAILQLIKNNPRSQTPSAIVIVPTRELAIFINEICSPIASDIGLTTENLIGGTSVRQSLVTKADLLIGTPGRICDVSKRKAITCSYLHIDSNEMFTSSMKSSLNDIFNQITGLRKKNNHCNKTIDLQ